MGKTVGAEQQLELPTLWLKSAGSLQPEEGPETFFFFSIDLERKCPGYHTLGSSTTGIFMRKIGHLHMTQPRPAMAAPPLFPPLLLRSLLLLVNAPIFSRSSRTISHCILLIYPSKHLSDLSPSPSSLQSGPQLLSILHTVMTVGPRHSLIKLFKGRRLLPG